METLDVASLLMREELWMVLGLGLVIVDIFLGSFVLLPVGLAAFVISGLLFGQSQGVVGETALLDDWSDLVILFGVLSLVSLGIVRVLVKSSTAETKDINDY